MKNKLFFAFAAVLFAAITVFNVNLAQQEAAGDITLAGVEMVVMALEPCPECGGTGFSCSISTVCSDGGHVSCTGTSSCTRWAGAWVQCDGNTIWC